MRNSLQRFTGFASITLLLAAFFAACGGLDPRKVTREPNGTGNQASGGDDPGPGSGGSDARGGEPGNPFGGALFEGGAPPVLDGPPSVVEVSPADAAMDVEVDSNVSLLFSEALDPATVTSESVQVLRGATQVDGELSLDKNLVATFAPSRRLGLATTYDVAVSTAVTDSTGTALQEAFASSFTTRDGTWTVDLPFVDDPYNHWNPYGEARLGIDDSGNALAVWQDSADGQVYGRWYRQATGSWQAPQLLSNTSANLTMPDVSVSPEGDAVVVWGQDLGATYNIMARRYVDGAWGGTPEITNGSLATIENVNTGPYVKVKGGRLIIWWTHQRYVMPTTYYYLYAVSTETDGAWPASPTSLDSGNSTATSESFGYSAVAMDSAGNGMLVHNVYLAATASTQLRFSKYVAATNDWEYPADLGGATGMYRYEPPTVALDENGAAMVAWSTYYAMPYNVMASRYTKALGFDTPVPLDSLDTRTQLHGPASLASDGTDFFIAWMQQVGSTYNAYANRYSTADDAWAGAELISDGDTGLNSAPAVAADPQGNAMVMWIQGTPVNGNYDTVQFRYARYRADTGAWAAPGAMSSGHLSYQGNMAVAAGNGIVAALTGYFGSYTAEDPGQPYFNIFE